MNNLLTGLAVGLLSLLALPGAGLFGSTSSGQDTQPAPVTITLVRWPFT